MKTNLKKILIYILFFSLSAEGMTYIDALRDKQTNDSFSKITQKDDLGNKGIPYGEWDKIKLNKYGFNDSDNYSKDKKSKIRILCLGDSITFGTFTPPHNWTNYLEEALKSDGLDAEVINASFPGNNYSQIIKRFENEYLDFSPDIVIIYKDFRHYMAPPITEKQDFRDLYESILKKSRLFKKILEKEDKDPKKRLLNKRRKLNIKITKKTIREEGLLEYEKDLAHLIYLCKSNNITLVLSYFPNLVTEQNKETYITEVYRTLYFYPTIDENVYIKSLKRYNELTKAIAYQENMPYIDISDNLGNTKEYFVDDYHLTVKGAKLVALSYAKFLERIIRSRQ